MMSIYPVGCYVQLSNKSIATVISSDPVSPFRPTVKIIKDEFGDDMADGPVIRLSRERDVHIVRALQAKQFKKD
jgi:hypothetical protein